jgi:tetratricopeptide (TPR) repeat protein
VWDFLPAAAVSFAVAAVRAPGSGGSGDGQAAEPGREAVGRQLLSLIFGLQAAQRLPEVLAGLARDPHDRQALAELEHQVSEAFRADHAMAARAAAVIAAFYRQRADAGDVGALVELGGFLYWDEPEAARAAYQEAIDAGHLPALIDLAKVLRNVLEDEGAAMAAYEQAAASADADLSAEAMYEIAFVHVGHRAAGAARAMFEQVIATGHPVWAAAAMVGLADALTRREDPEGAQALYREAIEAGDADWSAHASFSLGTLLERKRDVAGAKAAWQPVIDSRNPEWARAAFTSLVNLLSQHEDADGLRAAYQGGAALGNPDAPYALVQLGNLLKDQGDDSGAHAARQQAIDAGCEDPGSLRELMSPAPEPAPQPAARPYPPGLPPEFNPANMIRAGLDVLDHGLPPLPEDLTYDMAIPAACWKAEHCAVVLVLTFAQHGHDQHVPMAMQVIYSRGEDGRWVPPAFVSGGSFHCDPVRDPEPTRDPDCGPMTYGSSSRAREAAPGRPAFIATGRAAPEVRYLAVAKDGREDRRPLESHFGVWVVCTEQPGPFEVAGLDENGTVLAVLPHPLQPPRC